MAGYWTNKGADGIRVDDRPRHGPSAALLAGTREAARLLRVANDSGTLEPGKRADIVAVPGNVLQNIHSTEHPVFVVKGGVVVVQKGAASGPG